MLQKVEPVFEILYLYYLITVFQMFPFRNKFAFLNIELKIVGYNL